MDYDYDFSSLPKRTVWLRPFIWLLLIVAPFAWIIAFAIATSEMYGGSEGDGFFGAGLVGFIIVYGSWFIWLLVLRRSGGRAFARANNLGTTVPDPVPPLLAQIEGDGRAFHNSYELQAGTTAVTVYDFSIVATKVMARYRKHYAGAVVQLDASLPHLYINARNNRFGYQTYRKGQRFVPEGPFTDSFEVFLPEGQQVDVLSVLTPDVMQVMLDNASNYDLEVKADTLYIYSDQPVFTQTGLPHLMHAAEQLAAELNHRAGSWHEPVGAQRQPLAATFWRRHWVAVGLTVGLIFLTLVLLVLPTVITAF